MLSDLQALTNEELDRRAAEVVMGWELINDYANKR